MARGEPVRRAILALVALERSPRGRRASELAETLGVTTRTVHRLLQTLQDAGIPLTSEVDGPERYWRLVGGGHLAPNLQMSEVLALLCAEQNAGPGLRGTVLGAPLRSAAEKVRALLPGDAAARLLTLARAHLTLPGPHHQYANRDVEIAALRRAIEGRVTVRMRYRSKGPSRPRELDPYLLVQHAGALYVVGHCHRHGDVRTFLLDRLRAVELTARKFAAQRGFDPARHFAGAWGVYRGRPENIRLAFSPAVARWASERVWPGQRSFTTHLDGGASLVLRVAATPDLIAEILSLGARVRAEAPKHLAETVAREHFAAAGTATKGLREKGRSVRPAVTRGSVSVFSDGNPPRGRARGSR